jgi:hypothetical protein
VKAILARIVESLSRKRFDFGPKPRKSMKKAAVSLITVVVALLSTALTASPVEAQDAPDPSGHWEGAIEVPGSPLEINVDLTVDEEGVWTGDISIPAQMAQDVPLINVSVDGKSVTFAMEVPGDPTFVGTLSEDGKTISGTFTQGGAELEFTLTRSDL